MEETNSARVDDCVNFEKLKKIKLNDDNENDDDLFKDEGSSSKNDQHSLLVAQHYNKLQEKGLKERFNSKIFYLRNFNNWIKSMLISEYLQKIKDSIQFGSPLRVLDMCCGKGGDLLKWQKGNISYLICTDIASMSIEQCKARYEKITAHDPPERKSFNAEFFTCDATRDRLRERYSDPSIELNLVSCQFAFHYCFESPKQAETMLKNVSECLRPGGYFIGTIPDAYDIMKRQRNSRSDSFGNDIFEIKFLSDPNDLPIFGAKYNFHLDGVVDCPEFLVYFPALVKLAKKYSLKLVEVVRFEDYFHRNIGRGRNLLEKMSAVEQYGLQGNRMSRSNDNEYKHAKDFLLQRGGYDNCRRCGTLSASEWEAACNSLHDIRLPKSQRAHRMKMF
ncbi:CLUMA_CG018895, isoform A [Clunio marinus]|uniref:mRNA cap guanine-N(7) methyltransferase n=1 Tax=Clunio marinus TaxID=568069 RepID=A0A1J1J2W1_9DIPT|nr:CLUMA_CG018895, isoform A [Clunio marinus]